ncbi:type II secretion system major pseudopilin GspG [Pseudoduganella sp.]|uniref:type II secretion system major pseudopilin GspG n=1 Tax=Pseudoduganella sp. TaxID=1880898 RepID=UPI0035B28B8E
MQSPKNMRGFTLLELLVVVVIIGLLAAFVAPKYFGQIGRSKTQIAKAQIESFEKAMDQYRIDVGSYPTTSQGLVALFAQPNNVTNWNGPYLKKGIPDDPWGKPYVFASPGKNGREYDISSLGADGKENGTKEDADVTSWN